MHTIGLMILTAYLTGAITIGLIHILIGLLDFGLNLIKKDTGTARHSWHLGLRYIAWSFFLWPHFTYRFLKGKTVYN